MTGKDCNTYRVTVSLTRMVILKRAWLKNLRVLTRYHGIKSIPIHESIEYQN